MAEGAPASWRTLQPGSPVVAADGSTIGTVAAVLGSDVDDIFHGLRLRLTARHDDVVVLASDVAEITPESVSIRLLPAHASRLEPYRETESFDVAPAALDREDGNDKGNEPQPY